MSDIEIMFQELHDRLDELTARVEAIEDAAEADRKRAFLRHGTLIRKLNEIQDAYEAGKTIVRMEEGGND